MASIDKRDTKTGVRYDVRYRDPEHRTQKKTFAKFSDARRFASTIEADKARGTYLDPNAGKITLRDYAESWLAVQTFERSSYETVARRLRKHVYPMLGSTELRSIRPSNLQALLRSLDHLAPRTRASILTTLSTVLSAAVDDELIIKNPAKARSVSKPRPDATPVVPWTVEGVHLVHDAMPERYRVAVTLGAGLGLRQGEIFGLAVDDVDFLRGVVTVRRQVRMHADGRLEFALPKGRKVRTVPLAGSVRDELAAHLATRPAVRVALPGEAQPVPLVLSTRERTALARTYFNRDVWKRALKEAGVADARENGMHALRHFYASVLLDGGESIKAVSLYLGHSDPGFTLRVYTHLMPSSDERSRRLIDAAITGHGTSMAHATGQPGGAAVTSGQ
jgi:integrase